MPVIRGLPQNPSFEMLKALTAAAANHGCPMLWVEENNIEVSKSQSTLCFNEDSLSERYEQLAPKGEVDLVVI